MGVFIIYSFANLLRTLFFFFNLINTTLVMCHPKLILRFRNFNTTLKKIRKFEKPVHITLTNWNSSKCDFNSTRQHAIKWFSRFCFNRSREKNVYFFFLISRTMKIELCSVFYCFCVLRNHVVKYLSGL